LSPSSITKGHEGIATGELLIEHRDAGFRDIRSLCDIEKLYLGLDLQREERQSRQQQADTAGDESHDVIFTKQD